MLPQKLWGAIISIGGRPIVLALSLIHASVSGADESLKLDGVYRNIWSIAASIGFCGAVLILLAVGTDVVIEVYRQPRAFRKRKQP